MVKVGKAKTERHEKREENKSQSLINPDGKGSQEALMAYRE
jgi:hypothetical protein